MMVRMMMSLMVNTVRAAVSKLSNFLFCHRFKFREAAICNENCNHICTHIAWLVLSMKEKRMNRENLARTPNNDNNIWIPNIPERKNCARENRLCAEKFSENEKSTRWTSEWKKNRYVTRPRMSLLMYRFAGAATAVFFLLLLLSFFLSCSINNNNNIKNMYLRQLYGTYGHIKRTLLFLLFHFFFILVQWWNESAERKIIMNSMAQH